MKEEPNYYAIIPANVRYDERLIPGAKLLYGEITALSNKKGYCWASDMYFATLYKTSKKTIQRWLGSLEESGYITRQVEYKEGSNEIVRRYVRLCPDPMDKNDNTPMDKKVRDNNTSINNTINNTNNVQNGSAADSLQERFDKLWKLYPIKKGKALAFKSYKRDIKKKDVTDSLIEKGILKYISNCKKENTDKRYMKHGGTFFSQQVYLDDYEADGSMQEVESSNKPKPVVIPADWIN